MRGENKLAAEGWGAVSLVIGGGVSSASWLGAVFGGSLLARSHRSSCNKNYGDCSLYPFARRYCSRHQEV